MQPGVLLSPPAEGKWSPFTTSMDLSTLSKAWFLCAYSSFQNVALEMMLLLALSNRAWIKQVEGPKYLRLTPLLFFKYCFQKNKLPIPHVYWSRPITSFIPQPHALWVCKKNKKNPPIYAHLLKMRRERETRRNVRGSIIKYNIAKGCSFIYKHQLLCIS